MDIPDRTSAFRHKRTLRRSSFAHILRLLMETRVAQVRAELKSLTTIEHDELDTFHPNGPFGIWVRALIGPENGRGEESFDFLVCTLDWLKDNLHGDFTLGRHYVFTRSWDYAALYTFVAHYCHTCTGSNWHEVGEKLSRLGRWEFEDYRPHPSEK
jgi:hypothetical protein